MNYQPDFIQDPNDLMLLAGAGPEPEFDSVTQDFLHQSYRELKDRCTPGGLLEFASLGQRTPWLHRLTFATRGLGRTKAGEVQHVQRHTIAVRFLPDYLRHADRFEMLRYLEPQEPAPLHPNICPITRTICIEIYPGETLVELAESLHDLLRWRLRQLAEHDALNKEACSYGRQFVHAPIDDRPLFGRRWVSQIELEPMEAAP